MNARFVQVILGLVFSMTSLSAQAGVFGAGNTGDMTLQLQFAKANAITFLRVIDAESFEVFANDKPLSDLYRACRQMMYLGAMRTEFAIVDSIPDTGYHAVMRRHGTMIHASRTELESLTKAGLITAQALTAHVLHEVGHDCVYKGAKVTDSFDPLLDKLGDSLTRAASAQTLNLHRDLDFIQKVQKRELLSFMQLSSATRSAIAQKYLDYIGDWAYVAHRDLVSMDRPAPATQFLADQNTSWFPGWSVLPLPNSTLKSVVRSLIQASYETKGISYFDGTSNRALPTQLTCRSQNVGGVDSTSCDLKVSWSPLASTGLGQKSVVISFDLDVFSKLTFRKLQVNE